MPNLAIPIIPASLREAAMPSANPGPSPSPSPGLEIGYRPTPDDIVILRAALNRAKGLPPDIVDCIFDHAEYWAHSSAVVDYGSELRHSLRIAGTGAQENTFLLRSPPLGLTHLCRGDARLAEELVYDSSEARPLPLAKEHDAAFFARLANYSTPRLANPARKIVFTIRSHDQGWGNSDDDDPYASSWTWFEAGLERLDALQECDAKCTYDACRESSTEKCPALPVCGLRPIHPSTILSDADDQPRYLYHHPLLPDDRHNIRRNKAASRDWQDHVITWSYLDDIEPTSDAGAELHRQGRGRASGDGGLTRLSRSASTSTGLCDEELRCYFSLRFSMHFDAATPGIR
ncbi:hypothetical protein XA68_17159 [Ophiocordyceps unilateralis]|uniref:Uncharacterized protein n=1 Tax=Ophiocordyceps unilateralis TaxID=268505 RepID=A0A2A9PKS1_OPHUN|nr:hypothetical protein XA68_17159 [Ophiocordyceps unilateralis]